MKDEQIALVQSSFARIAPIGRAASDKFYARLFESAPHVRTLFPEDMSVQKMQLMQMLGIAVNGLSRADRAAPAVRQLGQRHNGYGVKDEYYGYVGDALIYALSKSLGDEFTPELGAAWVEAYAILANTMKTAQKSGKTPEDS